MEIEKTFSKSYYMIFVFVWNLFRRYPQLEEEHVRIIYEIYQIPQVLPKKTEYTLKFTWSV